ncbi:MAG: hypothetical protein Q8S13_09780, partial [Dehalococcoidia bacterium]|nr:hypothetical protein [Dehalococcoidia bacterium]
MARPAKDLDLVALQELVGTDGQMAVEISRNVSAVPGREDFEHVAAWSITHDAISNGELYENLRRFAGGCDGTGAYHFKATKPGVRAKPVEWEMRLPGAPRAPAHVQAEDAAKRQQQQATGQAAWPPAPGTFPQGAPVSSMPVGGGGGMGGYGGFMPMMGPWGMMPGMPGMGMGMYPGPQQPAQPSGPLGELGLILKPLIERLVAQPAVPVAPARDAEVEKLREEAQRAREEAARDRAEAARKFDELAAQRREDKLAADARLAEERAKADAVAARAEVDRRFADAKAEADRRHESLLAELKLAREEG